MKRVLLLFWIGFAACPVWAGMTIGFDTRTLNDVLPALTVRELEIPLSETSTIGVIVEDMRITGLAPGGGANGKGHILTTMRVRVPQFGLNLPVQSRLSLHITEDASGDLLELRFDQVEIQLPLAGRVDIAAFLPPIQFPAENAFRVQGADGDVRVRSKLSDIEMDEKVLRFEFDLSAGPSLD